MSALAHSSPLSGTHGVKGPETDLQQGKSLAPVPVIDLPHRWEGGKVVPGTSPVECPRCEWNGEPQELFHGRGFRLTGKDCMLGPFECARCEFLRCILFKTAEVEGRPVTETSQVCDLDLNAPVELDGLDTTWQSIFISSDIPKSDIDRYGMIRRHKLSNDKLCGTSSKWARRRLAECARSHDFCQSQNDDGFLPTRLINLQPGWEGLDVRLEDAHYVRLASSYTTLSYSWGDYRPACITTVETLAQNKERIPWDNLPLTFQDAAAFTLSLGIQYLWIDSICIIQEDEEDWHREAGRMYAVYKNSYLTLSALSGHDSTYGLRKMSVEQDSVLFAELRIAQTNYPLYMRRNHYLDSVAKDSIRGDLFFDEIRRRYPLLSRAWAYQERTVSPRVMFFTDSEMIFQCLGRGECECGATQEYCQGTAAELSKTDMFLKTRTHSPTEGSSEEDRSTGAMSLPMRALLGLKSKMEHLFATYSGDDTQAEMTCRARQAARTWRHKVVCEYTLLEMSMPRDRLPAIGAIAEQFQRVRVGETYLAGLWSGSLLDDLLWISSPQLESPKSKESLERPFSLPTWSWASLHSSITYLLEGWVTVPKAEVLEARCSYVGDRAFGVLQSSKLILRGRILHSLLKWADTHVSLCFHNGDSWTEFSDSVKGVMRTLWINMDQDRDGIQNIPSHQEVDILEISRSKDNYSSMSEWHFLLLRREDPDKFVHTRAGKVTFVLSPERGDGQVEDELPQDGFESIFEGRSVMTTCEIR